MARNQPQLTWDDNHRSLRSAAIAFCGGLVLASLAYQRNGIAAFIVAGISTAVAVLPAVGFRYHFAQSGIRVTAFGISLARIYPNEILECRVIAIRPFVDVSGFGVRRSGDRHIFYWGGSRGLLIKLQSGKEIMLGSKDPEKLAGYVEAIMDSSAG